MKSLFDGIGATGKFAWGPSKQEMPNEDSEKNLDDIVDDKIEIVDVEKKNENKRQKKNSYDKNEELDNQIMAVLKTLEKSNGPSLEECNAILDRIETLDKDGTLYIAATGIFCESNTYREQWVRLSNKSDQFKKNWIAMMGKKIGLL